MSKRKNLFFPFDFPVQFPIDIDATQLLYAMEMFLMATRVGFDIFMDVLIILLKWVRCRLLHGHVGW